MVQRLAMVASESEVVFPADAVSVRIVLLSCDPSPPGFEEVLPRGGGIDIHVVNCCRGFGPWDYDLKRFDLDGVSNKEAGLRVRETRIQVVAVEADESRDSV